MSIKAIAVAFTMVFAAVSGQAFADEAATPAEANTTITQEAPAAGEQEAATEEAAKEEKATEAAE